MAPSHSSRFFCNKECEYFPCHKGIAEDEFNCLFCYCPLYFLGDQCGGSFTYSLKNPKVKICTNCTFPHRPESYGAILKKLREIKENKR